jgi:glycosyltransferase involved in cell wall biosynthesis
MKIVVLMSTFNGERFVVEQLKSIVDQLPSEAQVLIRDDGSTDATVKLIEQFDDRRVTLICGENIGFCKSFFALIDATPADAEIVFLSDQDDVWLPNKVDRVCGFLREKKLVPAAYCGRMQLVDSELRLLGFSPKYKRGASFECALAENIMSGCASAFNRAALAVISKHGDLRLIHFHDWWVYLVVSAFGEVFVDDVPTIMYRQHGKNVIGMGAGLHRAVNVLRFLVKNNWVQIMYAQAENFRRVYGANLDDTRRAYHLRYFNANDWRSALRLVFSLRRFRQTLIDDVLLRFLIAQALLSGRGIANKHVKGLAENCVSDHSAVGRNQ